MEEVNKDYIYQRVIEEAYYFIDTECTIRQAAKKFGVSKSTTYNDMAKRLPKINKMLFKKVGIIISINKAERHIRGGFTTKQRHKNKEA